ncbi:ABC-type lipoprotein export system ATPase subunit [Pedobacter sp. UYP30]|uniref:AbiJ-related protein n=1 Tax=Pedobacter sp. UYP30 TaxID=1756400 RepID=UPI003399D2B1
MVKFSKSVQVKIFKLLLGEWIRISNQANFEDGMSVLNSIWDLRAMPSEDDRYSDAYGDIVQHTINNQDWSDEQLFIDRLKIYDNQETFRKFIETFLEPKYYSDEEQLSLVSLEIDNELAKDKLRLVIEEYNDVGLPVQKIYQQEEINDLPAGIKKNNVPFYVFKNGSQGNIEDSEYFTLDPNKGWNDYSVVSGFALDYFSKVNAKQRIGYLKLIHKEEMKTYLELPDKFYTLSQDFCSLGTTEDYYFNLQKILGSKNMISILNALQDAAYFTEIHDSYEKNSNFTSSLIRDDEAERLLREIKPKLEGRSLEDLYSFSYKFKPAYSNEEINIEFELNDKKPISNRIFAIIGKNGTGKTQFMTSLPNNFAEGNKELFSGKMPVFSKIIAVSYSVFDNFSIPKKSAIFNYVYCGLKNQEGEIRNNKSLVLSFHHNWKRIISLERSERWRAVLLNFIDQNIVDSFIIKREIFSIGGDTYDVNLQGFNSIKNNLSSGQSIILYIITEVVANIRLDSLILYDEPETHLHPNAIVQLMNTIYELVNEFESYCLIATHSPLIVRELFSKNVYIMERDGNIPSIRRIGLECFGENLSVITDEVFGDREIPKQYKKIITELVDQGKTYDEIVKLLEFDEYPLSLNASIFIKNIIKYRLE